MESADDISCLHKQGVRRYANAYIDRQVRQPITALGTGHNLAVVELNNSSSEDLYLHTLQIIKNLSLPLFNAEWHPCFVCVF